MWRWDGSGVVSKQFRRFKLRNPNWQIYAVLSSVGFVWIYPYIANVFNRLTMSPERYRNHVKMNNSRAIYNAVCAGDIRLPFGTTLNFSRVFNESSEDTANSNESDKPSI